MWHVTIASASVLILVNLCLAYNKALNERSWMADIYKTDPTAVLKCYGIVIHFRAVLVHRDCGNILNVGKTQALIAEKRIEIPMIIRPKNPIYNLMMLILADPADICMRHEVFNVRLNGDELKHSDCTLVSARGKSFDEEAHLDIEDNVGVGYPSLILAKRDDNNNNKCKPSYFLMCLQRINYWERKVLVGIAGYHTTHHAKPISTCVTTFNAIGNDLTWVNSIKVAELLKSLDGYQKTGELKISSHYSDNFNIEVL